MIPRVSLREALSDPNLLGTAIAGDSWRSWRVLLIAAMGEELREDEEDQHRQQPRPDRDRELGDAHLGDAATRHTGSVPPAGGTCRLPC